ncbi:MAG: adenosine deaminase [Chloroflexota bacterium]
MTAPSDAIARMPKVELHLHLEGSLRPATLFTLAERNGKNLGVADADSLLTLYTFTDFGDFARLFRTGLDVLRSADDFSYATVALAAELAEQRVRYAEITTTPFQHSSRGVPLAEYAEGLNNGRRLAESEYGVAISWICDISRESEPAESTVALDLILGPNCPDGVIGLGLGGFEVGYPAEIFQEPFAKARAAGFASLPHAGETVGADSVRTAVRVLKANRIGHGVRCLEDDGVVAELIDKGIPLEVCQTSNVKLGVAASHDRHPLPELLARGLLVTLNTDDPAYFATNLNSELNLAYETHGVSVPRLGRMQDVAMAVSYAPDAVRESFARELADWSSE